MSDGTLEQSTDLCEYSTKELVEELCKREGVEIYTIPEGSSHEYYFDGAARILRVKK